MQAFRLSAIPVHRGGPYDSSCLALYRSAFPIIERIPYGDLHAYTEQDLSDFGALLDNEEFVGLYFVMHQTGASCLLYFAVRGDLRGQGYGSAALALLRELYPAGLFLFVEEPDAARPGNDLRLSRIRFYERNGLADAGFAYPLEIVYRLMTLNCQIVAADVDRACAQVMPAYLVGKGNIDTDPPASR